MTGGTSPRLQEAADLYAMIQPEYEPDRDIFRPDSARMHRLKEAVERLPDADKVIIRLYAELQSLRKLAALLGVGRDTMGREVRRIRETIMNEMGGIK